MFFFFFFFQAEDGIRDLTVTGVQTCALPISTPAPTSATAATRLLNARGHRSRSHRLEFIKFINDPRPWSEGVARSEEHTSELQSQSNLVCRLLLEKKKKQLYSVARYKLKRNR